MKNGKTWPKSLQNFVPWGDVMDDDVVVPDPTYAVAPVIKSDASFVDRTMSDLRKAFAVYKHAPADSMWLAIKDIVSKIDEMATGRAEPMFYVSALDPGVGKTQSIVHSVRNLPDDVGVLICLSRIDEIGSLIAEMGLSNSEYSTKVSVSSEDELRKKGIDLGNKDHNQARVLFTTQQMVDARLCKVSAFAALNEFFYRGKPRAVRIWDESMLPGEVLTLNIDRIASILEITRKVDSKLAERLLDLIAAVNGQLDGSTYAVPDFETEHNNAMRFLHLNKADVDKKTRECAEKLRHLSGRPVSITHDAQGKTVLTYRDTLPDDFAPVLICDASARVRKTYPLWEVHRKNLLNLHRAAKSYKNLKVHIWHKGGGKGAWDKKGSKANELIAGIVETIKTKPTEDWLLVVHQEDKWHIGDIKHEILTLLPDLQNRLNFLTWGNHHATNKYVDISNVILAGTLFFQPSDYEGMYRLSAAKPAEVPIDYDDVDDLELGEHAHVILQALCRGSVRKCIDNCCAPMDAYIIAAKNTGIPALIPTVFPHCEVLRWQPIQQELTGHIKNAVEILDRCLKESPDGYLNLSFSDHRKMMGIGQSLYTNRVRKHIDFQDELRKRGIQQAGKGKRNTHFRKTEGNPF